MWWPSPFRRKKKKALEVCAEFGSGDLLLSGDPTGPDSREREREGHLPMGRTVRQGQGNRVAASRTRKRRKEDGWE